MFDMVNCQYLQDGIKISKTGEGGVLAKKLVKC